MFEIGGGTVVDFWSNGKSGNVVDYGVAVADHNLAYDYRNGVSAAAVLPEPGSLWLLAGGLLGLLLWRRRATVA